MSRTILSLALVTGISLVHAGCKACSKNKTEQPDAAATAQPVEAPPVKTADRDAITVTGTAAAVLVDDKVFMWTDGRNSGVGIAPDKARWTSGGFEYQSNGGVRVLASGGALYWKPEQSADAQPLLPLFDQATEAPEGFRINASAGRGGMYQISLSGPENRRVRMGMSKSPPKATVWLEATAPVIGKAAPALDKDAGWQHEEDGTPKSALPEGAKAVATKEPEAQALGDWKADLDKLRGGGVSFGSKALVDLDADGTDDGLVCVTGGKDDYDCYVVRVRPDHREYFGVVFPYEGQAPLVFEKAGHTYAMLVGKVGSKGARMLRVLRYDGHSFTADPIK